MTAPGSAGEQTDPETVAALFDRAGCDACAFFAWVDARLPARAAPLFVRLTPVPDVTSTFKLRKLDLQRDGYDPAPER